VKATRKRRAAAAAMDLSAGADGEVRIRLSGRLGVETVAAIWEKAVEEIVKGRPRRVRVEASEVEYCDGAGLGLLVEMRRRVEQMGGELEIRGLAPDYARLLEMFDLSEFQEVRAAKPVAGRVAEEVGLAVVNLGRDLRQLVSFVGELAMALGYAARHPGKVRWRDGWLTAEQAGANAVPIVVLISFLIGLIMAFQSAMPMLRFGAELYVADLVAIAMLRELGPLMTAIIVAGRTGSAFAAELGTMKVNEELDALTTMGLDPVRFLVTSRVLAAVLIMPLLTLVSNVAGLVGGAVVLLSLNYSLVAYVNQVLGAVDMNDLLTGLFKAGVFAFLVGGVGCLRGLQTRSSASAVGISATRAVVSGIVLIVLADGVFSVVFYYLEI
jgi:phospholipid/cholesterol/gamma-HCH transport system permease protein